MPTAIEFNHVGKQYRLGLVSTKTLSHDLNRWWHTAILKKENPYLKIGETNDRSVVGNSEYVWALRDIDFKVEQGDVVGIIGKNGAGKSTLLKLLSKVTGPTVGTIRARGRIGALLEVGTGFHPEMTGRENIYMNGAIIGMSKAEVSRKLDEIIDFSGCERYIDTPVKRYSSGMTVRLGFAVAAHLDPEILVVDEVLAVGDAEFQKKAIGKMQDVSRGEGRTVLFVSHNMASIRALCKHGVLLEDGTVKEKGDINKVVDLYLNDNVQWAKGGSLFFENLDRALGNDNIRIKSFEVRPLHGERITVNSGFQIDIEFMNFVSRAMIDACVEMQDMNELVIFQHACVISPDSDSRIGMYSVHLEVPENLINTGKYRIKVWFGKSRRELLWGFLDYCLEIEDYLDPGLGYIISTPGLLRPELNTTISYHDLS